MKIKFFITVLIFLLISLQITAQNKTQRPKIGLVLSGGGAKGIAHIGVLKVLEKEGIKIDYITGTSMGALVGGLYAIGYSAEELEKIIVSQNWEDLLTDKISRTDRTIDNRKNLDRYIASFPLEGTEISLPRGAVSGQKVSELLTKLTVSVHQQKDFSKFKIPFKCIATDIETGLPVVIEKGFLPDALRASMSIPTIYAPIEIEGKLLVDGGLTRNFPVQDIKAMGADIIIGVDVNNMLLSKKDLKDFTLITEQTLTISMMDVNKKQRELCTIIIDPDMSEFNTGSFNKIKQIIKSGENAALKNIDEIRKIAGIENSAAERHPETYANEIKIEKIQVIGQNKISEEFIIRKLDIDIDEILTYDKIAEGVEKVYGTGYFERVTYEVKDNMNNNDLIIKVVEKGTDFINVGLRYDSEQKASLLFNLTIKNVITQNSTLLFDAHLGDYPKVKGSFLLPINFLSYFALETNMWYRKLDVYIYDDDEKVIEYDTTLSAGNINFQTFTFYNFIFGMGTEIENVVLNVDLAKDNYNVNNKELYFWNSYVFYKYDTMNRIYFPEKGIDLYSEFKYIFDFSLDESGITKNNDCYRVYAVIKSAYPLSNRFSLHIDGKAGAAFGGNVPVNYLFYFGGMNNIEDRVFEFAGLKYMQVSGNYCQMLNAGLQIELFDIFYLIPSVSALRIKIHSLDLNSIPIDEVIPGFSVKAGVLTPVGPIEAAVSAGKDFKEPFFSFYMGYAF